MSELIGFQCSLCGQFHTELPFAYGPQAPANYFGIPESERDQRVALSPDLCVIDGDQFYICGRLELPVIDADERFSWDVWVSLSRDNFQRTLDIWDQPDREKEPPMFGWLSNSIAGYPETLSLKTNVHTRPPGRKPFIELEPTDHPLAVEQREGITLARVQEIAEMVLHQ